MHPTSCFNAVVQPEKVSPANDDVERKPVILLAGNKANFGQTFGHPKLIARKR
jgi:hypothetical protein